MAAGKWNMQKASGGVASITVADGVSNTAVVLPESGTVATTSNIVGFKNYIINGGFDVWQRGTSFLSLPSGYYHADRWCTYSPSGTMNILMNTDSYNKAQLEWRKNNSNLEYITQRIEDVRTVSPYDIASSSSITFTLSFDVYSSVDTTMVLGYGFNYGTGGSSSIMEPNNKIVSISNGFNVISHTFTIDSDIYFLNKTIGYNSFFEVQLSNRVSVNGTFFIRHAQLEEGSIATPFENRPIGLELSLCQRYYQVYGDSTQGINIIGYSIAGQTERTSFMFPIQMRDNPNATRVGTWYTSNCSQPTIVAKSKNGFSLQTIVAATGGFEYTCSGTGQYLIFEKEL